MRKNIIGFILFFSLISNLWANGFSAAVSPPRFELNAQPGQVIRQVLEVYNVSGRAEQYDIKSNDWSLNGADLTFSDYLQPGSCRQWVRLERRKITVGKKGKRKFRFEIHVPADAQSRECRFALMVEGASQAGNKVAGNISLPVKGRFAVIVYLAVGNAKPQLQLQTIQLSGGKAVAKVVNQGNAHGRLQGTLAGVDASGQPLDFSISTMPIMPGETRLLALTPHLNGKQHKQPIRSPLILKGDLYWSNGAFAINKRL